PEDQPPRGPGPRPDGRTVLLRCGRLVRRARRPAGFLRNLGQRERQLSVVAVSTHSDLPGVVWVGMTAARGPGTAATASGSGLRSRCSNRLPRLPRPSASAFSFTSPPRGRYSIGTSRTRYLARTAAFLISWEKAMPGERTSSPDQTWLRKIHIPDWESFSWCRNSTRLTRLSTWLARKCESFIDSRF